MRKGYGLRAVEGVPYVLSLLAAIAYATVSIYRHNAFASNAFDLGVQDQTVWGYSQLQMIPNTVEMIRNLLGDHFHPILMVIAPLYWIWDDVRVLLLVQALLIALGGIPIFWWARRQLGLPAAVLIEVAYLLFWGVLSAVVYDFHHIAFAVPAVSFGLYAVVTRNNRLLWPMVALGLLTRENIALTFAAMGVYCAIVQRRWRLGAALASLCLAWFLVVVELVMPAIAGKPYTHWTYTALGAGPASAAVFALRHPIESLALLFDSTTKLKLWVGLLGAWLLLPLASPISLVMAPELLERLWSSNPALWSASFHYSLVIAPILAFAAIDSLARLSSWLPPPRRASGGGRKSRAPTLLAAAMLLSGLVLTFAVVKPLDDVRSYNWLAEVPQIESCLDVIPSSAGVSASNTLVPHLTHRREIYVLTMNSDAEYIAINLASYGDHFFPGEQAQIRATIVKSLAAGYGVACSRGTTVVLYRRGGTSTLSSSVADFVSGR